MTLEELMECQTAYTMPPNPVYIYDLLDLFLMPSNNHQVDYAEIMRRELLAPLGMDHSGFRNISGTHLDVTYLDEKSKRDASRAPGVVHPMRYCAGFGNTTLSDASRMARALADPRGLVANDGRTVLLTRRELDDFFRPHGHYEGWGLGAAELTCGGRVIDKGGSCDQDQFSFWVDRGSGVGMIAMCNCGRRPDELINAFKSNVERVFYPEATPVVTERGGPLGISNDHFLQHPLESEQVRKLFEGSHGRVALLFDYDTAQSGIVHWSGLALEVERQKDDSFRVTTPGRFHGITIRKMAGAISRRDYLAIGDTSFVESNARLPSQREIEYAQKEFESFCGSYSNKDHRALSALSQMPSHSTDMTASRPTKYFVLCGNQQQPRGGFKFWIMPLSASSKSVPEHSIPYYPVLYLCTKKGTIQSRVCV